MYFNKEKMKTFFTKTDDFYKNELEGGDDDESFDFDKDDLDKTKKPGQEIKLSPNNFSE
jgi:hypothetical protein